MIYINEPLTQKLPAFYRFMGGWEFVRSTQKLKKLVNTPRHWTGAKIEITKHEARYDDDVQTAVFSDGLLVYCNHVNQKIELVTAHPGLDNEYEVPAAVCQRCGAGWDESGEQIVEGEL